MFGGRYTIERILLKFTQMRDSLKKAIEDCEREKEKKEETIAIANQDIDCILASISRANKAIKGLEQLV